jgi:hypothetical protein
MPIVDSTIQEPQADKMALLFTLLPSELEGYALVSVKRYSFEVLNDCFCLLIGGRHKKIAWREYIKAKKPVSSTEDVSVEFDSATFPTGSGFD